MTPDDIATRNHALKYHAITLALGGYDAILPRIPFSAERIRDALPDAWHMNSLPLKKWDIAAGWRVGNTAYLTDRWRYEPNGIACALVGPLQGPDMPTRAFCLSLSEAVCVLKHVARHHPKLGNWPLPFEYLKGDA